MLPKWATSYAPPAAFSLVGGCGSRFQFLLHYRDLFFGTALSCAGR